MSVNNNYIAFTIGPIYSTFQQVRKSRELWAASYLFSMVAYKLLAKLHAESPGCIISPAFNGEPLAKDIGLYPDRIFCRGNDKITMSFCENKKWESLREVAQEITSIEADQQAIMDYFKVMIVGYNTAEGENPIAIGNQLLDTAELQQTWRTEDRDDVLLKFFRQVNKQKVNEKKWITSHLSLTDFRGEIRFESMAEIATRHLAKKNLRPDERRKYEELVQRYCIQPEDSDDDEDRSQSSFMEELKEVLSKTETFKSHHKYVCIVEADGDQVGAYINSMKAGKENGQQDEQMLQLSKALADWGRSVQTSINEYRGIPIYIGGDDVLFFAPVVGATGNVLTLCQQLAASFESTFNQLPAQNDKTGTPIKPTLSIGVSITFYKYPLYEAKKKANSLLFETAKKSRNTLAISLLKHSGASLDFCLPLDLTNNCIAATFAALAKAVFPTENYTTSVIQHFREHLPVYKELQHLPQTTRTLAVANYLYNHFDDNEDFIRKISAFANAVFDQHANKETEELIHQIYSGLRLLKFLNGQDDEK